MKEEKLRKREKENNIDYRIRRTTFITITGVMVFLFLFFEMVGNINFLEYPNPTAVLEEGMSNDYLTKLSKEMDMVYRYETDTEPEYIVISENFDKTSMEVSSVLETLEGMKLLHQCVSFKDAKALDVQHIQDTVTTIIVCGDVSGTALKRAQLDSFIEKGIDIVYTQMPTADAIEKQKLSDVFGIYKMNGILKQKGMRFIDEVFWGGNLDLEELEYSLEDIQLEPTCKIYAYGLKGSDGDEVETNEQLPPIMWRNTLGDSKIFVVNGKFFEENKGYGILTAIVSNIKGDFLYPIVNASVMVYDSIPYDGEANEELMMKLYARDSLQFQTDILMPNIVSICKRLDVIPTFYTSAETKLPEMDYFERSVLDLGGELIYDETAQVRAIDISNPEGRIWDQYPNLPVIVTGFSKNDDDMTKLYSIGSTFGIVVHRVDVSKIINADTEDVDWVSVSKDYSEYIAYYNEDFGMLEYMTASDAAIRYMEYMIMKPEISYREDAIEVQIENMPEKASFILRTEKAIEKITDGEFIELSENIYLIETTSEKLKIFLGGKSNSKYQGNFFELED